MPPERKRLSDSEIETLKTWIDAGAVSPPDEIADDPRAHWSFQSIERPQTPVTQEVEWSRNPIDKFISQKHQQRQILPRPLAAQHVLLRRIYLDLTGLPPSREQLQAFLNDKSPGAYERVVDSLLSSPHYGERWGRHWLDVWRYSDWYGFQGQVRFSQKNIWHWRDWVVESLNADKGYDRMVTEMLAGDEIVPFDPKSLRATGFLVRNRNTDSREQWIRDTIEHTAKAFLGLTMACVQCHDHPYDPIWHEEYYRYRNIFEPVQVGIDSGGGGPGDTDLAGVARIFDQNQNAVTKFYLRGNDRTPDADRKITPGVPQLFFNWNEPEQIKLPPKARIPHLRKPVHNQSIERLKHNVQQSEQAVSEARKYIEETKRRIANSTSDHSIPKADSFLIETFQKMQNDVWKQGRGQWEFRDGYLSQSLVNEVQDCYLEALRQPPANFTLRLKLRIVSGNDAQAGILFNRSEDGSRGESVLLCPNEKRPGLRFFFEYGDERHFYDKYARDVPIQPERDYVLRIDVRDKLVNVYVNDSLQQAYEVNSSDPGSLRILTIGAAAKFLHLQIDPLPDDSPMVPAGAISLFASIPSLDRSHPSQLSLANSVFEQSQLQLEVDQAELTSYQATWEADFWKLLNAPPESDINATMAHKKRLDELAIVAQAFQRHLTFAKAKKAEFQAGHELKVATVQEQTSLTEDKEEAEKLAKSLEAAKKKLTSTTKQVEAAKKSLQDPPSPKYQGLRGNYGSSSGRRLALAHWVTDPRNPLTARVAINHIWLRHIGNPFVKTVFDFGRSGEKPSHPRLLDWLASELMKPSQIMQLNEGKMLWKSGKPSVGPWSMKHIHRLIVTSRTYRTASTPDVQNLVADPDNRWIWRMPPQRMDAETVRDSVLAVSDGLDKKLGGPDLPSSDGMAVPRRSLYFHSSPENQMSFLKLFDGVDPTECYTRHISIVPHQALALFNSQIVIVQSRVLARKLSKQFNDTDTFLKAAFEQVLCRPVSDQELELCRNFLARREKNYRTKNNRNATSRTLNETALPSLDPRLHARENLVHSLFNHHDFVTVK